jgi:hypothetical protein
MFYVFGFRLFEKTVTGLKQWFFFKTKRFDLTLILLALGQWALSLVCR